MKTKIKWLMTLTIISIVSLLAACSNGEEDSTGEVQSKTTKTELTISEGFQEHPVWVVVRGTSAIDRNSNIREVIEFEDGKATVYEVEELKIEDILDLSDDELVDLVAKNLNEKHDEMSKDVKFFDVASFNESLEQMYSNIEDKDNKYLGVNNLKEVYDNHLNEYGTMTEDIYISSEGDRIIESNQYNLDIEIDNMGQNTEEIVLNIPNGNIDLHTNEGHEAFEDLIFISYYSLDDIIYGGERAEAIKDMYIKQLEEYGAFKDAEGLIQSIPQSFVPNPNVWVKSDVNLTLKPESVRAKVFDTTFAGLESSTSSFVTRVNDSFVGFSLDEPNTENDNVTTEGK